MRLGDFKGFRSPLPGTETKIKYILVINHSITLPMPHLPHQALMSLEACSPILQDVGHDLGKIMTSITHLGVDSSLRQNLPPHFQFR